VLGWAGIVLVWVVFALGYRDSTLIADTARDVAVAVQLLDARVLPAEGPSLYGTWVLSPLWFWFFALLVGATPSLAIAYVLVGALAMSKLLLAWRIGERLQGSLFAATFATMMFWPGWSFIEQVVATHTNLVQATGLLFALAVLRASDRPDALRITLMSGAFALALATHPTNLAYAPLLLLPLRAAARTRFAAWPGWVIGAVVVLLSLIPALFHEAQIEGGASRDFLERLPEPEALRRWPGALRALLFDPQGSFLQQVGLHWPQLARVLQGFYVALATLGLVGWLFTPKAQRSTLILTLFALTAWCAFLVAIRPATPAWMLLSVQPVAYGLIAYGIANLLSRWQSTWRFAAFAAVFGASVSAALAYAAAREARAAAGFEWHASARVSDVAQPPVSGDIRTPHFPPRTQDAVGTLGCRSSQRLALFGDLAVLAEASQGATLLLSDCEAAHWPALGTYAGARNVAGVPAGVASALGLRGTRWSSLVWLDVARSIAPLEGRKIVANTRYPPYDSSDLEPSSIVVDESLARDEVLVVSSLLLGFVMPQATLSIEGAPLAPSADTGNSRYFRCPQRAGCRVQGMVTGGAPAFLQVFVVGGKPSRGDRA